MENAAFSVVQRPKPRSEHRPILAHLVFVLDLAERLERVEVGSVVAAAPARSGERESRVGLPALERLEHLFLLDARRLRELRDRWGAFELDGQLLHEMREPYVQLLEAARHADRPTLVAEMALDLSDDVRGRVGRQLDAAVDVEAVDRLDEA